MGNVSAAAGGLPASQTRKAKRDGVYESGGSRVQFGAAAMQGWRRYMEDRVAIHDKRFDEVGLLMFAVFDGHGGEQTSEYCRQHLGEHLWQHIIRETASARLDRAATASPGSAPLDDDFRPFITREVIADAFAEFDWGLCALDQDESRQHMSCGTTATVLLVDTKAQRVFLVHLGDSRAIAFRPDSLKVLHVTRDHTPDDPIEESRILHVAARAEGPFTAITMRGNRVFVGGCSSLNVCRGFGDHDFKRTRGLHSSHQAVSNVPEVFEHRYGNGRGQQHPLAIILASDGIWGATFTGIDRPKGVSINEQMVNFCQSSCVTTPGAYSTGLCAALDNLVAKKLPQLGKSSDNLAAVLVTIMPYEPETTSESSHPDNDDNDDAASASRDDDEEEDSEEEELVNIDI